MSHKTFGVSPSTGGKLNKDRTIFRFGKRVQAIVIANATDQARLIDVAAYERSFQSKGVTYVHPSYFYLEVPARSTLTSIPFDAPEGL